MRKKSKVFTTLMVITLAIVFVSCGGAGGGAGSGEIRTVGLHGDPNDEYYQVNFVSGVE